MEGACTMWGTWDGMGSPCIACIATAAITYCLCSLGKDRWGPIAKTRGIPRDVPGVLFVHLLLFLSRSRARSNLFY